MSHKRDGRAHPGAGNSSSSPVRPGRRRFVKWFLVTSAGALIASAVYPIGRYLSPPRLPESTAQQVQAGTIHDSDLLEDGFKIIRFGLDSCIVTFREDKGLILRYCHDGVYHLNGKNIAGPPPRPLKAYAVNADPRDGTIVVSRT